MFCLPILTESDFVTLKALMQSPFPDRYRDWLELSSQLVSERGASGIARIAVNPREFAEYMSNAGRARDIQALLDFVAFNPWHDPD